MVNGWRYRVVSVLGVVAIVVVASTVANHPLVEAVFAATPVVGTLPINSARGFEIAAETVIAIGVVVVTLTPLYKPRPRRILDIWMLAVRRTVVALLALATIGYFDYTYRLPRSTLLIVGGLLMAGLPMWFVLIRRRPRPESGRTIVVGDDRDSIQQVYDAFGRDIVGYVAPADVSGDGAGRRQTPRSDGGAVSSPQRCLGGLSRLDEVIVEYDIDMAILAFTYPDREEFFSALDTCYRHGVQAKVHRSNAHLVLTPDVSGSEFVDIDLEPWDPQDHVAKRLFDITFAVVGLAVVSPVIVAITVAILLEDGRPILYGQERTATFGDVLTVYKFRSMVTGAEAESGATLSAEDAGGHDPRVTRVGAILRQTHLDEIPQLWVILAGEMSVVGPRPERPSLDEDMEAEAEQWRSRWFVKPGLTGLAQINDATGFSPKEKLRYDIKYIRQQSFWFDLKIVVRQTWQVLIDVVAVVRGTDTE